MKEAPMTRSRTRSLREQFNKAVETLMMSQHPNEDHRVLLHSFSHSSGFVPLGFPSMVFNEATSQWPSHQRSSSEMREPISLAPQGVQKSKNHQEYEDITQRIYNLKIIQEEPIGAVRDQLEDGVIFETSQDSNTEDQTWPELWGVQEAQNAKKPIETGLYVIRNPDTIPWPFIAPNKEFSLFSISPT